MTARLDPMLIKARAARRHADVVLGHVYRWYQNQERRKGSAAGEAAYDYVRRVGDIVYRLWKIVERLEAQS